MNIKEKALIVEFLNDLSERYGNASCNDWKFPDDWSDEEIKEFFNSTDIGRKLIDDGFPCGRHTVDGIVLDMLIEKFKTGV